MKFRISSVTVRIYVENAKIPPAIFASGIIVLIELEVKQELSLVY